MLKKKYAVSLAWDVEERRVRRVEAPKKKPGPKKSALSIVLALTCIDLSSGEYEQEYPFDKRLPPIPPKDFAVTEDVRMQRIQARLDLIRRMICAGRGDEVEDIPPDME